MSDRYAENREKVLTAFRSGKYTQITGAYRGSTSCFCAIGLMREATRGKEPWCPLGGPFAVAVASTVLRDCGIFPSSYGTLTRWNDHKGLTFEKIADRLESRFHGHPDRMVEL